MTTEQSQDKAASGAAPDAGTTGTEQGNTPAVENTGTPEGSESGAPGTPPAEGDAAGDAATGDQTAPETGAAAAGETTAETGAAPGAEAGAQETSSTPAATTATPSADPKPKAVFPAPSKKAGAGASGQVVNKAAPAAPAKAAQAQQQSTVKAGAGVEAMAEKTGPTNIADIDRILKDVPASNCTPIMQIVQYLKDMAPRRPISPADGARQQASLYRAIQTIINNEDKYFKEVFTALLKLVALYEDAGFNDIHVFRFMEDVALPTDDRRAFTKLVTMLKMLADPKSRKTVAAQIGWTETLRYGLSETGRQRVLSYFDV